MTKTEKAIDVISNNLNTLERALSNKDDTIQDLKWEISDLKETLDCRNATIKELEKQLDMHRNGCFMTPPKKAKPVKKNTVSNDELATALGNVYARITSLPIGRSEKAESNICKLADDVERLREAVLGSRSIINWT